MMSRVFGQGKLTYLRFNVGLSYTDDLLEVSPGLSFLFGRQTLVSETSFWDVNTVKLRPQL